MANRLSQKDRVMAHLWDYGEITSWEAIKEYGITRLSDLIYKLRNEGWNIENEWEHTKNRYGDPVKYVRYKLVKKPFIKLEDVNKMIKNDIANKIIKEFEKMNDVKIEIDGISEMEYLVVGMTFFDKKGIKKRQNGYCFKGITEELFIESLKEILNLFEKTLKENK